MSESKMVFERCMLQLELLVNNTSEEVKHESHEEKYPRLAVELSSSLYLVEIIRAESLTQDTEYKATAVGYLKSIENRIQEIIEEIGATL